MSPNKHIHNTQPFVSDVYQRQAALGLSAGAGKYFNDKNTITVLQGFEGVRGGF